MASHRLVQLVTKTLGVNAAENMYNDLNQKHFEGGVKLNDREMLLEAAVAVGAVGDPPTRRRREEKKTERFLARGLWQSGRSLSCEFFFKTSRFFFLLYIEELLHEYFTREWF